jgi:hypothetical protein
VIFCFRWLSPYETISHWCAIATPETSRRQIWKPWHFRNVSSGRFGAAAQDDGKLDFYVKLYLMQVGGGDLGDCQRSMYSVKLGLVFLCFDARLVALTEA